MIAAQAHTLIDPGLRHDGSEAPLRKVLRTIMAGTVWPKVWGRNFGQINIIQQMIREAERERPVGVTTLDQTAQEIAGDVWQHFGGLVLRSGESYLDELVASRRRERLVARAAKLGVDPSTPLWTTELLRATYQTHNAVMRLRSLPARDTYITTSDDEIEQPGWYAIRSAGNRQDRPPVSRVHRRQRHTEREAA